MEERRVGFDVNDDFNEDDILYSHEQAKEKSKLQRR